MTGTAIKTNGIGQKTTAYLNLTVSMADRPLPKKQNNQFTVQQGEKAAVTPKENA